ncbi:LOW QUALITY PROTEIN: ornithine decarboxylase antizyme 3 [Notechis scutatus]|uniref:LOW QUALITY PROTEIN: ornithine decarboxylase antizyme 3 n=1 Tax=Notechis scutatus TaxID=8663 RepID=A0A6J1VL42_9SAUR|nr:LOW QUALITY PROTEIN: ornithine decarboxylase antizyme 3 [Notechis scutatus]
MTPSNTKATTLARPETLSTRPRYCPQCSEFEGASSNRCGPSAPADWLSPTEIYQAANLTVFASDDQHSDRPVQLDFHFTHGSQGASHWHGLLQGSTLFLDTPRLALDFNSRESLTATLEYIEEKTGAEQVLVNFHKARRDRGKIGALGELFILVVVFGLGVNFQASERNIYGLPIINPNDKGKRRIG